MDMSVQKTVQAWFFQKQKQYVSLIVFHVITMLLLNVYGLFGIVSNTVSSLPMS